MHIMNNIRPKALLPILHTIPAWREFRRSLPALQPLVFVPTMGALHDGHGSLVKLAHEIAGPQGHVATSIFVNPLQFGPAEDFPRYPRPFEMDVELLSNCGAGSLFAPEPAEMYPGGQPAITIDPGPLGNILEGAIRPGHFRGVCSVVAKLLEIITPTHLILGQKDFQQQLVLKQMIVDLNMPVNVVTAPTIREPDGLAMSSRNRYLSSTDRPKAAAIYAALTRASTELLAGHNDAADLRRGMEHAITRAGLNVQYAVACDPRTLQEYSSLVDCPCILLVAAKLGNTRLIDNLIV